MSTLEEIKNAELAKLNSEIDRNNAERDKLEQEAADIRKNIHPGWVLFGKLMSIIIAGF